MKTTIIAVVYFMSSIMAMAQFSGWPINGTTSHWDSIRTNMYPVGQLYSAATERCWITGVATITNEITYSCYAGITNAIFTNGSVVYTNYCVSYTNVTKTNQLSPFTYTVGANTYTGYPFLSKGFLSKIDNVIKSACTNFAITNYAGSDWFNSYLNRTNVNGDGPDTIPRYTFASLCYKEGVGRVSNYGTNEWGNPTSGVAFFTYEPARTQNITLAECRDIWGTNTYHRIGGISTNYYEAAYPVVKYISNGIAPLVSMDLIIYGTAFSNTYPPSFYASAETVSVSAVYNNCGRYWSNISSFALSDTMPNTGDVLAVMYTNSFILYKDEVARIHAVDLNERWKVLKPLLYTDYEKSYPYDASWASLKYLLTFTNATGDEAAWDANMIIMSNALAASTNYGTTGGGGYPNWKVTYITNTGLPKVDTMNALKWSQEKGQYILTLPTYVTNLASEYRMFLYSTGSTNYSGFSQTNHSFYFDFFIDKFPTRNTYALWETGTNNGCNAFTSSLISANASVALPQDVPVYSEWYLENPNQTLGAFDKGPTYIFDWTVAGGLTFK